MELYTGQLQDLYDRIPRRHSTENITGINNILEDYAGILSKIESINAWYEKNTAPFYPSLEAIQQNIKLSNSNKHSKKTKDTLFADASGNLKDDIQSLIDVCRDGNTIP